MARENIFVLLVVVKRKTKFHKNIGCLDIRLLIGALEKMYWKQIIMCLRTIVCQSK